MNPEKAVIIIPTYNEALVIADTVHQVFQAVAASTRAQCHILVFDSHSTDSTADQIRQLQTIYPRLHLQTEPTKSGLGMAYHQAMRYACDILQADIILEFDADLSHQPKYILPLIEGLHDNEVVVGSRYIPGGSIPLQWAWHRKCLSYIGNQLARRVLSPRYHDYTSGLRATRASVLRNVLPHAFISKHYAYKLELFWLLHKAGVSILEYPIAFIDRTKGSSKLPANSILDGLRVMMLLRWRGWKKQLKL